MAELSRMECKGCKKFFRYDSDKLDFPRCPYCNKVNTSTELKEATKELAKVFFKDTGKQLAKHSWRFFR